MGHSKNCKYGRNVANSLGLQYVFFKPFQTVLQFCLIPQKLVMVDFSCLFGKLKNLETSWLSPFHFLSPCFSFLLFLLCFWISAKSKIRQSKVNSRSVAGPMG